MDVLGTNVTVSTTATFTLVNGVQEGSSFYNRIGRRIAMKSLHLVGSFAFNQGMSTGGEYDRVMLIYDRQPNGAAPTIADVLTDYNNAGATSTTSLSALNMNNSDRFMVLRDIRLATFENDAASPPNALNEAFIDYTTNRVNVNEFVKLKGLETHYRATTNPAVIGDIATGALWVVTFGSIPVATAPLDFNFQTRLRYWDT